MIDNSFEIREVALMMAIDICGKAARAGADVEGATIVEIARGFERYMVGAHPPEAGAEIELHRRALNLLSIAKFDDETTLPYEYKAKDLWRTECDDVMRLLRTAIGDEA